MGALDISTPQAVTNTKTKSARKRKSAHSSEYLYTLAKKKTPNTTNTPSGSQPTDPDTSDEEPISEEPE